MACSCFRLGLGIGQACPEFVRGVFMLVLLVVVAREPTCSAVVVSQANG
jgi:hypothetical protein